MILETVSGYKIDFDFFCLSLTAVTIAKKRGRKKGVEGGKRARQYVEFKRFQCVE
jgi:hypothetical protein